jgi:hypothetical protein
MASNPPTAAADVSRLAAEPGGGQAATNTGPFILGDRLRIHAVDSIIAAGFGEVVEGANCFCGQVAVSKCSACLRVAYCGTVCQRSHWRAAHKIDCKVFRGENLYHEFLKSCETKVLEDWERKTPDMPFFGCYIRRAFRERIIIFAVKIEKAHFSLDGTSIHNLLNIMFPLMKQKMTASLIGEINTGVLTYSYNGGLNVGPWATYHIPNAEGDVLCLTISARIADLGE